jgi:hypothetical protein
MLRVNKVVAGFPAPRKDAAAQILRTERLAAARLDASVKHFFDQVD